MFSLFAIVFSSLSILAIVLPTVPSSYWLFRVFDYPRLQIVGLHLLSIICLLAACGLQPTALLLVLLLAIQLGQQSYRILPYTALGKQEVADYAEVYPELAKLRLLIWNVYQENRQADAFCECVKAQDPDIILLCETNQWWCQATQSLHDLYPHRIEVPMENTYGMCLLSKYPLPKREVNHLVDEQIPSIQAIVQLPTAVEIGLYAVHPAPPVPEYAKTTRKRNTEINMIGKKVQESTLPSLVFGDFNDVAWSRNIQHFREISGLLDLRKGRKILATFPTYSALLRLPIDQVYCSNEFRLISLERLAAMGSDHYPLCVELALVDPISTERAQPVVALH